jgi:hypothetical protein
VAVGVRSGGDEVEDVTVEDELGDAVEAQVLHQAREVPVEEKVVAAAGPQVQIGDDGCVVGAVSFEQTLLLMLEPRLMVSTNPRDV